MYSITKFLIILVLVLRFILYTLYKYSLIVYYELITFSCVNLMCLIYVLYSYYMYFIVKTHSVLCLLLFSDKFYIHFGGSLEY